MTHASALTSRQCRKELVAELKKLLSTTARNDSERARVRHISQGKLLPRQRTNQLLDPGSPLLEAAPLTAHEIYGGKVPTASVIVGIGTVEGYRYLVVASDATVSSGTYYPLAVRRHLHVQGIASPNYLPCIYLVDSGGAMLLNRDKVLPDCDHFGRIFYSQANLPAHGIPQIAAATRSCTAGGAYVSVVSGKTVIVKNQGTIFLAGLSLVKVATGENVTLEELGDDELHSKTSGVTDHLTASDADALRRVRDIVVTPPKSPEAPRNTEPIVAPIRNQTDLYDVVPVDARMPYDVHEVIEIIVDDRKYRESKAESGTTLAAAFARIHGHHVGIIANSDILFAELARKGMYFIELCDQRDTPPMFLQNTTGFIAGCKYEAGDIAKHGVEMVNAVATTRVPKFIVVIGGAFGADSYSTYGRAYPPRSLWMQPDARISVTGGPQVAITPSTACHNQIERSSENWSQEEQDESEAPIHEQLECQSHYYYSSAHLRDDGVINLTDTRRILGIVLDVVSGAPLDEQGFGVFHM